MYLTSKEVHQKYGISPAHCRRDLAEKGCRVKNYTFCGRVCCSYYEPDVKRLVAERDARKAKKRENYAFRPDVMRGTKSKLKKVIPERMYIKLRNAWFGMMRRCYTNDRPDYHHYRSFGITICDEWLNDFDSFALWALNNGVAYDLSLDRIDNDKGYSPDNCRWTTRTQQNNNSSQNKIIRYNGKEQTLAEWAREYNINYEKLWHRVNAGWPIKDALTKPLNYGPTKNSLIMTYKGKQQSLADWARETGLPYYLVLERYKRGWPPEKVLSSKNYKGKR